MHGMSDLVTDDVLERLAMGQHLGADRNVVGAGLVEPAAFPDAELDLPDLRVSFDVRVGEVFQQIPQCIDVVRIGVLRPVVFQLDIESDLEEVVLKILQALFLGIQEDDMKIALGPKAGDVVPAAGWRSSA